MTQKNHSTFKTHLVSDWKKKSENLGASYSPPKQQNSFETSNPEVHQPSAAGKRPVTFRNQNCLGITEQVSSK